MSLLSLCANALRVQFKGSAILAFALLLLLLIDPANQLPPHVERNPSGSPLQHSGTVYLLLFGVFAAIKRRSATSLSSEFADRTSNQNYATSSQLPTALATAIAALLLSPPALFLFFTSNAVSVDAPLVFSCIGVGVFFIVADEVTEALVRSHIANDALALRIGFTSGFVFGAAISWSFGMYEVSFITFVAFALALVGMRTRLYARVNVQACRWRKNA